MAPRKTKPGQSPASKDAFATTRWSVVAKAGRSPSPEAGEALSILCRNYWFPLYAFVRRVGYSPEDAQDLTQEFFARLLEKGDLALADRKRGRFRSFLLGAMKHFLANQRRRRGTRKRGGDVKVLSLDFDSGENRYRRIECADHMTPERLYEKRWALELLDLVLNRLHEEHRVAGKLKSFEILKQFLTGEDTKGAYAAVAEQLTMSEGAVKVAVHRLRRRYRKLLEEEIAQTVAGPASLEDELAELLAALGSDR